MGFDLEKLLRPNVKKLVPYSSARDDFKGKAEIFLDANENSMGSVLRNDFNRYPDPMQWALKKKINKVKGVPVENIFVGNGSDEPIDLLYRAFCNPGKDNAILFPPTYGMYEVAANINDVATKKIVMTKDFQPDVEKALKEVDTNTKLIFVCSPNNPTGNIAKFFLVKQLLEKFNGIVVVDEAYHDFTNEKSWTKELNKYPNLVVLQTFSKAYGLASLRIGMAFASAEIINVLNKIKPPYNVSGATQELAMKALEKRKKMAKWTKEILAERKLLYKKLKEIPLIKKVYASDANFFLVKVEDPAKVYDYLAGNGVVVRNRSSLPLCEGCLRITIGTPKENKKLVELLNNYK